MMIDNDDPEFTDVELKAIRAYTCLMHEDQLREPDIVYDDEDLPIIDSTGFSEIACELLQSCREMVLHHRGLLTLETAEYPDG